MADIDALFEMTDPTGRASTVVRADLVLTPEPLPGGWVRIEGERVAEVGTGPAPAGHAAGDVVDLGDRVLAPGFVDIHAHGGGGAAYTDGASAARTVLETHLSHGTTSAMASLVTDEIATLADQIRALGPLVRRGEMLGIHLEGPWLSGLHCGAHDPDSLRDPRPEDVARLLAAGEGAVRMVTLAVERPGGMEAVRQLREAGVVVALGHSHATYAEARAAIEAGASVATHLFNASRPIDHHEPGLIVALLEHPQVTVELIADGVHLHPSIVRDVARAAPGRIALVTDAMAAAGRGDGDYRLGPQQVEVRDGVARLAGEGTPDQDDGVIAGSTLTLDRAVRYCVRTAGLDLVDAVRAATLTPADAVGQEDVGRLASGAWADMVLLGPDLEVEEVRWHGQAVPR